MDPNVDDMTGVERPRTRRMVSVLAVLVPVIVLVGASAWFIRAYVVPPMISIPEPAMASAADTPPTAIAAVAPSETTGNAAPETAPEPASAFRYTTDSAAIWASVPLPGPPRSVRSVAPEPSVAAGEPTAGPVPLPPARPRVSVAANGDRVPLPRPRPSN